MSSYLNTYKLCVLCIHLSLFIAVIPHTLYAQLGGLRQDAENWTATTDTTRLIAIVPENIYANEFIRIRYKIYGVNEQGKVQLPTQIGNLKLAVGPSIHTIRTGNIFKSVEHSYSFSHNGPGIYNIGPAKWVDSKGKSIESEPLSIKVLSECAPIQIKKDTAYIRIIKSILSGITPPENWQNNFFIRREIPQRVTEGSTFQVTYKLYLKNGDIAVYEIIPPIYPTRQIKNITALSDVRKTSVENYEGEWYYTIILWQADLLAPSSGSMEIKEMSVVCSPTQAPWVEDVAKIPSLTLQIVPN